MGQSQGKESRHFEGSDAVAGSREHRAGEGSGVSGDATSRSARGRVSRSDLSFLGIGSGSGTRASDRNDAAERRETRQEREARRQEKERAAREKERERSLQEEHVDGGYLVTLGTYVGTEDFSKAVVRHLQIERKLAPFWRGLNDWSDSWAEHQLVAAARGLPIPAADDPPDPDLVPRPLPVSSSSNLQNLTVPMGPRTMSAASDRSGSNAGSGVPSPTSATPGRSSPFKPRAKALAAALSVGSRNTSATDLAPKEIQLPTDPFVNGQPLEVFLYKDASECPICFLTYPPYLNHTRCCDQPICSECFVQIKRAEPHLPEHHPDGGTRDPNAPLQPEDPPEMLMSEPTACPYCQQPDFGVTYEPPPFRRGLAFSSSSSNFHPTAMSSQSSLNSTVPPTSPTQPNRRRGHSLSASAPNVITTDRVRPDWATKLAAARAHQARRAAAATALHTAAFLLGGNETSRSILRPGRFSRRNTGQNSSAAGDSRQADTPAEGAEGGDAATAAGPGRRRNRMAELEEMMLAEAVRLSIAAEADRQRKEEKALRKEAKKKLKEERKALKKQGSDPYSGGTSGASGSSLSLGLGRRRGNSTTSNLRMEATVHGASSAVKGSETPPEATSSRMDTDSKGKGVDRGSAEDLSEPTSSATSLPIPTSSSRGGSHLRQMSNASSIGSSLADTPPGSYTGQGLAGAEGSASQTQASDADAGTESLFNFQSLAEMVGVNLEDGTRVDDEEHDVSHGRPLSRVNEEDDKEGMGSEHVEEATTRTTTLSKSGGDLPTPELMITPETPAPLDELASEQKQLGHPSISEKPSQVAP
ncbi:hypothetical protein CC79DRAFT_1365184 [Sarocladium strictum]